MLRATPLVVTLLALACAPDARERDCATVREIVGQSQSTPRRYYDYGAEQVPTLSPIERLRQTTWRSDEVRAAVTAMLDDGGWQMYTPYSLANARPSAADRLAELCGLPRVTVVTEK
jgi:hypothetical protein